MKDSVAGVMIAENPAQLLRARRDMLGLDVQQAAQRIGVGPAVYEGWEKGQPVDRQYVYAIKGGLMFDRGVVVERFRAIFEVGQDQYVSKSTLDRAPVTSWQDKVEEVAGAIRDIRRR